MARSVETEVLLVRVPAIIGDMTQERRDRAVAGIAYNEGITLQEAGERLIGILEAALAAGYNELDRRN